MIRVGLVGFGLAGRVFHAPLISSVEGLELAAVVERSTDKAVALYPGITTYRTLDEMLADATIKLIVIATPNKTHHDLALRALEAARSVIVDKPMALNSAGIVDLMELADGIGLKLAPFHNRRYDSDFHTIQNVLLERLLGRVVHFESTLDRWRPGATRVAWKEDVEEGGILLDLGTHLVDQALLLFGKPASIRAEILRERDGEGANDSFTIELRYYVGPRVTLSANCLSSLPRPRFHIRGTAGNFVKNGVDPQEEALGKITRIDSPDWGKEAPEHWGTLSVDADHSMVSRPVESIPGDYRQFYEGVRDAMLGKGPVPVSAIDAWRTARVLEYAVESSRASREVECDWTSEPA